MRELIYFIPPEKHDSETLRNILSQHNEIRFVSLMGIDLGGNATDEKIPIELFLDDIEGFLAHGAQTDGSSVVLHEIAVLNNAKVDIIPDRDTNWIIDYNWDNIQEETSLPVGTLRLPAFLVHNGKTVDSRSILKNAVENFKTNVMKLMIKYPEAAKSIGINSPEEIDKIVLTAATELEFWVKTPDDKADIEKLSTSQQLKEQYWKRTQGTVRTALEKTISYMEKYNLEPEMGHKEVGGVRSGIGSNGSSNHVMEQLEIDWKYSTALQAADNELLAKEIVRDIFRHYELEVTFLAKPIEGVAGSGEHTHVGAAAKLKNGKTKNIFTPRDMGRDYLSTIGYGAIMGILKNYEVINPFVAPSNSAFNRLKPGFEAPVCIVCCLGHTVDNPSRNRSVLVGLIRDMYNEYATRFEVRSPNPHSNTYLVMACLYQSMLDGITAAITSGKSESELELELSKNAGTPGFYLDKDRAYRSEMDVFEHFSPDERNKIFGMPPATVWENMRNLDIYKDKKNVLLNENVFTNEIVNSFKAANISKWETELQSRIIPMNIEIVRACTKIHHSDTATDLDDAMWYKINNIRIELMKDSLDKKSLFTNIREALNNKEYELASSLQQEMTLKMDEIRDLYSIYKRNLFEAVE
ncbi:MAG: glutamine synthetase [Clostridiales bacterium]|jgi:glutamine synthetase|nr:glutamine synthetase [Clostridiales bacterium]